MIWPILMVIGVLTFLWQAIVVLIRCREGSTWRDVAELLPGLVVSCVLFNVAAHGMIR